MKDVQIARELLELAKSLGQVDTLGLDPLAVSVSQYLTENPNPPDNEFHAWAEDSGINPHDAEAAAYRLATIFTRFFYGGKANEKDVGEDDVDAQELSMGIEIEREHTPDIVVSKRIALDHLAEFKDYYTRLKKMEEKAKKEMGEGGAD